MKIKDKVVVVTGGGHGIGEARRGDGKTFCPRGSARSDRG